MQKAMESVRGVPRLRWGERKDCSYGGTVAALLKSIGVEVTYEEVMGLSGACYRICMKESWCLSGGIPQTG